MLHLAGFSRRVSCFFASVSIRLLGSYRSGEVNCGISCWLSWTVSRVRCAGALSSWNTNAILQCADCVCHCTIFDETTACQIWRVFWDRRTLDFCCRLSKCVIPHYILLRDSVDLCFHWCHNLYVLFVRHSTTCWNCTTRIYWTYYECLWYFKLYF